MAAHASNASDGEDINDFLRRIKELGEQRDREDEERTRKLEEEIMAGRRERQARRAGTNPHVFTRVEENTTCVR